MISIARHRSSLAVGNIVGSAISNILGAFSLGLIFRKDKKPIVFDRSSRIYTLLLLLLTILIAGLSEFGHHDMWKIVGGVAIGLFAVYIASIAWSITKGLLAAPELSDSDSDSDNESSSDEREIQSWQNANGSTERIATTTLTKPPPTTDTIESIEMPNATASTPERLSTPAVDIPQSDSTAGPASEEPRATSSQASRRATHKHGIPYHIGNLVFGFFAIVLSSYVLSHAASNLVDEIGLSDVLFGVVILSIATTLPEKFIAVISGWRGHAGILVANTVGSNIFLLSLYRLSHRGRLRKLMFYAIRHLTRFRYNRPIHQSMMEVRMHPRSETKQRCFTFRLSVNPRARIFSFQDHLGNQVHHFDLPQHHRELSIVADSLVNLDPMPELPASLPGNSWAELEQLITQGDHWEMLMPSYYAHHSPLLDDLTRELGIDRPQDRDPLSLVRDINVGIFDKFAYVRKSTAVNSPIEASLGNRQGVCQDFAHIMIAVVRGLRIPCRYVSGYLYHGDEHQDRSSEGATHAWVEALLPGLGWVGFDPTNNLIAGNRHIRTAVGRDYSDVPPTLGTMKGRAETELQVRVRVTPSQTLLPPDEDFVADEEWSLFLEDDPEAQQAYDSQQQQQQ